ncbi:MAG: hypothetical protein MJ076_04120 [Clostridia bacterium]|nr:hypothetical protein [Clostridia bacterium]
MAKFEIVWKEDGWITLQEANPEKHVLEIACRAENGSVVEVRVRHSRGEEVKGDFLYKGESALPMNIDEFKKLYKKGKLEIKEL